MTLSEEIQDEIKSNSIIVYMKGTKLMPMCGFSSTVVNIMNMHGVEYKDINVLENPEIRVQLSSFSNWPAQITDVLFSFFNFSANRWDIF